MSPIEELVRNFQDLVALVPEIVQPFIVMLAGAIPFVEGEGGSIIGIVGGLDPVVAAVAAAAGNFLSVLLVVLVSTRARAAAVDRRAARADAPATVTSGSTTGGVRMLETEPSPTETVSTETVSTEETSKGRRRFKKWLVRFGVPGASILGPLAIPTQFTAAILVASGTPRRWVLLWQAVAIVLWTTVATISVWLAVKVVVLG